MYADCPTSCEQRRRALQVREQDRSEGIRDAGGVGGFLDPAQEPQDVVLGDPDDLVGDQAVRLAVDGLHLLGRGAWRGRTLLRDRHRTST